MPTGRFQIGDLSFLFEGDLKELAHCQEIMREVRQAEGRLKRTSGAERVVLVYDQDLEGERGTFDKMRLRAYDQSKNYTLDIGVTDNNPLGIYVASDQNIDVWNREKQSGYEITPEGEAVGRGDRSHVQKGQTPPVQDPDFSPNSEDAKSLLGKIKRYVPDTIASDVTIEGTPLPECVRGLARRLERGTSYAKRVRSVIGGPLDEVEVGWAAEAVRLLDSPKRLRNCEA